MEIIATVLQFLPLLFLLWLANLSENLKQSEQHARTGTGLAITAYVILSLMYGIFILAGILLSLFGLLARSAGEVRTTPVPEAGVDPALIQRMVDVLPFVGFSIWIPSLLGILLLIPALRRWISRVIPIDPKNRVHTVALSSSMLIWIYFFFFVAVGIQNLAQWTESQEMGNPIPSLWAQQITFFIIALIGVGWLSWRRSWKETLNRLGLVRPTLRESLIGIGSGLLLVGGALLLETIAQTAGIAGDPNVEKLTEQLIGPLFGSVLGILTLGLSAALGEEAIFRGALQPRFGLILTAILFSVVHSNYGFSISTLVVFLVGLVLGLMRQRYNTSTTMFVHATYNMTLGLLSYL
ncbi:CPBP family intramembrane glutamic endopeptidase [Paludifilum halophilum]|uniref:CAAX prenyl protease 2/Lysostaphin resistance protein A-like domain-containing protein n=1 Tax=Paludifilum halophilum TaxID=1642702 RepID=A0A235B6R9_9BACL|nr:CPBP family intramembrane glutamic endopeptidase [Paludifilum halophilum]OYD07994.1 hypothetical protein CHM34_07705 [Paludifilum halophilum]